MAVRGPVTIAAAVIEYAIRTCKRGPLLAYPGATVLELNFVDQKTKVSNTKPRFPINANPHSCYTSFFPT